MDPRHRITPQRISFLATPGPGECSNAPTTGRLAGPKLTHSSAYGFDIRAIRVIRGQKTPRLGWDSRPFRWYAETCNAFANCIWRVGRVKARDRSLGCA